MSDLVSSPPGKGRTSLRWFFIAAAAVVAVLVIDAVVLVAVAASAGRPDDSATREVYVTTKAIAKGTSGIDAVTSRAIEPKNVPRRYVPEGAISTTDEIVTKAALFDIPAGTIIQSGFFVDPAVTSRQVEAVEVIVTTGAVAKGQALDPAVADGRVKPTPVPNLRLPANRVTSIDQLRGKAAAIDIAEHTALTESMVATP